MAAQVPLEHLVRVRVPVGLPNSMDICIPGYDDDSSIDEFSSKKVDEIIQKTKDLLGVDHVRVDDSLDSYFIFIGKDTSTKDDKHSAWINERNERVDFDYIRWTVIANGKTLELAWDGVLKYNSLKGMTMSEYLLKEIKGYQCPGSVPLSTLKSKLLSEIYQGLRIEESLLFRSLAS